MKRFIKITYLMILSSTFAYAAPMSTSYLGDAEWNKTAETAFTPLEIGGITMNAIEDAFEKCRKFNDACVLKSVNVDHDYDGFTNSGNYRRILKMSAVVQSIDSLNQSGALIRADKTITEKNSWSTSYDGSFSILEHLGLRYEALNQALLKCHSEEFEFCAILATELTESNNYRDGKRWSSSKATIRGYGLK